jgi:CheY-like chemotaxis protein
MTYHVLVVDDDPVISALLTALLSRAAWKTTTVSDARTAFDHLGREPCDLLISDVNMPGATGLELREWIRADARLVGLPIVLLTATVTDPKIDVRSDAKTLVLAKPVHPPTFVNVLRDWLSEIA